MPPFRVTKLQSFVTRDLTLSTFTVAILSCLFINERLASIGFAKPPSTQPNIIFIMADDLGWGDLGVFHQNASSHDRKHKTPKLDWLAASGLQMRAHYCPAPVCAPSRSSLLTGVHQGNALVRDNQFDRELEDRPTLGSVMRAAGYKTCLVGKYGLQGGTRDKQQIGTPDDWPSYPTKRGFDEFFGYVSHYAGHLHYPNDPWELANEKHAGTVNLWQSDASGDSEVSEQLSKCYTTDLFTARTKHFITEHQKTNQDQPFFLYLAYDTPHAALQIPTIAYPEGGGASGGLQWVGEPGNMINTATGVVDSYRHPDYAGKGWTDVEERFATMIRRIDSSVGDLQQLLNDLGIAEDTLVVFTSDNGPHHESYLKGDDQEDVRYQPTSFQSYGPYDGTKRDCWEGGIRMPTLAWWPGVIDEGRIDSSPSQFHDWMATFSDLAGIPAPARCDGVSLVPTLTGKGQQTAPTTYIEYLNGSKTPDYEDFKASRRGKRRKQMQVIRMRGVDGKSYKGVRYDIQSHLDHFEIFDVEADPNEENDLANSSDAFRELHQRMKDRVLQIRRPNASTPRPFDDALIAPMERQNTPTDRHRLTEIVYGKTDTPWVPQTDQLKKVSQRETDAGNADLIVHPLKPNSTSEVTAFVNISEDGVYEIAVESDVPCFARLHEGHAFDLPKAGVKLPSIRRHLKAGIHPLRIIAVSGDQPAKVSIRWNR